MDYSSCAWFESLLGHCIFTCSFDWNQLLRDGAFVVLLTLLRMRSTSWKGCHKMTYSKWLVDVFSWTSGPFWRKCSFNYCTVLCFLEIKWFWWHFVVTTHITLLIDLNVTVISSFAGIGLEAVVLGWWKSWVLSGCSLTSAPPPVGCIMGPCM